MPAVIVTVWSVTGRVKVVDATPLLFVIAGLGLKLPFLPSMKLTLAPATGTPSFVAVTVNAVGSTVPGMPVWLLPPVTVSAIAAFAVSVKVVDL